MTREEIWRFIPNSTIYQVSNLGNFRKIIGDKYRYLKGSVDSHGYKQVSVNGRLTLLHRLVALTFVPNDKPNEYNIINHKDENPLNNTSTNLEWCTKQYNSTYGHAGRFKKKETVLINDDGSYECFESLTEMAKKKNIPLTSLHHLVHRKNHRFTRKCNKDNTFKVYYKSELSITEPPKEQR